MRISDALACAFLAVGIGFTLPAYALDIKGIGPDTPAADALRVGLNALKAGDGNGALQALNIAAAKGLVSARWKLGEMYADGVGVPRDDFRAYGLFTDIVSTHGDDSPRDATAPYVANAFVQLGSYYRSGIPGSPVKADPARARAYFSYAASYFSDANAQLAFARMLYYGEGGSADPIQAARWANLSADKGNPDAKSLLVVISLDVAKKHLEGGAPSAYDLRQATDWAQRASDYGSIEGQALYGKLLFDGDGFSRQPVDGLMNLTIAAARAPSDDRAIHDMQATARMAASAEEWTLAKQRADDWLRKNTAMPAAPGALTQ